MFNVLTARLDFAGLYVLDLYAGSGALGLEALSRGAATALFVESDARAAAMIEQNIAALGVRDAVVRRGSVAAVLAAGAPRPVDLVLADPPYEVGAPQVDDVLRSLVTAGWTAPGTVVVVERPASARDVAWPEGWSAWKPRRYGDTRVEFGQRC